jgi:hypothetical protein
LAPTTSHFWKPAAPRSRRGQHRSSWTPKPCPLPNCCRRRTGSLHRAMPTKSIRAGDRLDSVIDTLIEAFDQRTSPLASIVIHHCHGTATEVPAEAAAFGMRRPHFTTLIYGAWRPGESDEERHRNWVHTLDSRLVKSALAGGYANVLSDSDQPDRECLRRQRNASQPGEAAD